MKHKQALPSFILSVAALAYATSVTMVAAQEKRARVSSSDEELLPEVNHTARPKDAGRLISVAEISNLDPLLDAVAARADEIKYRSYTLKGKSTVVSGAILIPKGQPPAEGWPVVAWAHGSSGVGDQCAPSLIENESGKIDLYGYGGFVARLLEAGYAVTATDYEGLGTETDHPYIIADSEARSVIDSVRAAGEAEQSISKVWFAVGHSQGGQAAIAAGEMASSWGDGLDFRGTIGLAPVTDVGQAYNYGSPGPVDRGFYLLALQGLKTQNADLKFEDYLGPQALEMLPATGRDCTLKIWADFSGNLGDKFGDFQFAPQSPEAALKLQPLLDAQTVPRGRTPGPMLLVVGDKDPSIKPAVTKQAVRNARAAGTTAEFKLYPGADHYSVLAASSAGGSSDDVVQWLDKHRPQ